MDFSDSEIGTREMYERHLAPIRAVLGVEYNGEIKARIECLKYRIQELEAEVKDLQRENGRLRELLLNCTCTLRWPGRICIRCGYQWSEQPLDAKD